MIIDMIYDHFMILKFIFVLKGSQQCELPCRPLQIDQSHGIYRVAPKKTKTKKNKMAASSIIMYFEGCIHQLSNSSQMNGNAGG